MTAWSCSAKYDECPKGNTGDPFMCISKYARPDGLLNPEADRDNATEPTSAKSKATQLVLPQSTTSDSLGEFENFLVH